MVELRDAVGPVADRQGHRRHNVPFPGQQWVLKGGEEVCAERHLIGILPHKTSPRRMSDVVVRLCNANIARLGGQKAVFKDAITLEIRRRERWALVGPTGSGKSTLLQALCGAHRALPPRSITWPVLQGKVWPSKVIKHLTFESSRRYDAYMSERYESHTESLPKLMDYLPSTRGPVIDDLNLRGLLHQDMMALSNGQTRRARLAQVLLEPEWRVVLLDEVYTGLDKETRRLMHTYLGSMTRPIPLLALRPQDEIPPFITHVVGLADLQVTYIGARKYYKPLVQEHLLESPLEGEKGGEEVVALKNVNVSYGPRKVLDNLSWTIRQGERWGLTGANGSGKTTLLAMITGDHPRSWAEDVCIFGARRRVGRNLFDIQQRIGHASPEMRVPMHATPDGLLAKYPQRHFFLDKVNISGQERMDELAHGAQRFVVFLRAVLGNRDLIILDEPFQGMDAGMVQHCREIIRSLDGAVILVSHYEEEMDGIVHRVKSL